MITPEKLAEFDLLVRAAFPEVGKAVSELFDKLGELHMKLGGSEAAELTIAAIMLGCVEYSLKKHPKREAIESTAELVRESIAARAREMLS